MTKKDAKKADAKKKAKAKKPEQLKIKGTERDSIPEIDEADTEYRAARDAWMEMQGEMLEAQSTLTEVLKKHGKAKTGYEYEGKDGRLYEVYLPEVEEPQAKSRLVKPKKKPAE